MPEIDLSALRMGSPSEELRRAPWGPRLAGGVVVVLLAVAAWTFAWPLLRPTRSVPTAPVRAAAATAENAIPIAEAAGWIEPDPFPIAVRPLVSGRVESLLVQEGAVVRAGETVLATLASATLTAQRQRAEATVAERKRDVDVARAKLSLTKALAEQKAEPRTALAEAELALRELEARLAAARGARERTAADLALAIAGKEAQERLSSAGGTYALAQARAVAAVTSAEAAAIAAEREVTLLLQALATAERKWGLARELADGPVGLLEAVTVANAELAKAEAMLATAAVELQVAEREVGWLEVRAPAHGVVLRLIATPGTTVGPEGETIMTIYDPGRLRARIDVPLAAVGALRQGQQVELRTEVLGNVVVHGVVQRLQSESDLLKNTLQVKVQIQEPPALLRPETLCRARFLDTEQKEAKSGDAMFSLPKAAVHGDRVFVFDPEQRAAREVSVRVLREDGDTVLVTGALSIAQRVIIVPVLHGERVREAAP